MRRVAMALLFFLYRQIISKVISVAVLYLGSLTFATACHCPDAGPDIRMPQNGPGDIVFIGHVESVYPTDDDLLGHWKYLFGRKYEDGQKPTLDQARRLLLHTWGEFLPASTRSRIDKATSRRELDEINIADKWSTPRRVVLRILEAFTSTTTGRITVYTGSGPGDCGVDFKKNERWLVDAFRDDIGNWIAHKCSTTAPAAKTAAVIRELRVRQRSPEGSPKKR